MPMDLYEVHSCIFKMTLSNSAASNLFTPKVTDMADNENHPPEQEKPDKKLQLDLSEAMPHGFDEDEDDIIELKDEVSPPPQETEVEMEEEVLLDEDDEASELPAVENIIDLDALEDDDDEPENVIRLSNDLTFEEEETVDLPPIDKEPVLKADDHDDVLGWDGASSRPGGSAPSAGRGSREDCTRVVLR